MKTTQKVIVKENGKTIDVYLLGSGSKNAGKFCDASNTSDVYSKEQLKFI